MERSRTILTAALAASGLALAAGAGDLQAQAPAPYRVIVHAANATRSLPREQVARMFLKKTLTWPDGERVVPVDRREDAAVREAFSLAVLEKDVATVKGYWQRLIFTGRGVPPIQKATDAEVVAFVAATPGAIGYVSASGPLDAGVKVLALTGP